MRGFFRLFHFYRHHPCCRIWLSTGGEEEILSDYPQVGEYAVMGVGDALNAR